MEIFIISISFINIEKKHHVSKFLILIVTIVIKINEKTMKNKYKILWNFERIKSKQYKWFWIYLIGAKIDTTKKPQFQKLAFLNFPKIWSWACS